MITDVLSYARARLEALGYTEWESGFSFKNLPKGRMDSLFHVTLNAANGVAMNNDNLTMNVDFTVRVYRAPVRDVAGSIDTAIISADTILLDLMKTENRVTQSGIKNVGFNTMAIEPLDDSNDNGIIVRLDFTALVIFSTA